ncbi:MAG TPA: site-2 protease family protein [Vicinamibacterales bacterium]|jgi:membrane-associated protease RseP (regulator of RpoE activity)
MPDVFVRRLYPRDRLWVHIGLFLLTLGTTTLVGAGHYASFLADFRAVTVPGDWTLLLRGFWYSVTILAILGAHEFGHYFACRYYRVNASLPFFLPVPPPLLTGTLGAFIRIRQPIPSKRMLFDIGIAGPLAGFVVAVPALFIGLAMSHVAALPKDQTGMLSLGEPLLFKAATWMLFGSVADGYSLNMHPVAFASWFGLLATALNLFPIGQLDGGHIAYAVLGRRSTQLTLAAVGVAIVLTFISWSWLVWTILMIVMLFILGPKHPPTIDEHVPLDRTRLILALVALAVFVVTFMSAPIQPLDLLQK